MSSQRLISPARRRRRRLGLALVLLALAGGGAYVALGKKNKQKPSPYREYQVSRGSIQKTTLATGVVQPKTRLEVRPPVPGRAERILVKEGDRVNAGQILAWMSSTERAALLDGARSKGTREVERWTRIYKPIAVVSPGSGRIILRAVEPGQTISAQDSLFTISDRLIVRAEVDETDIAQIRPGQRVELTLDAYPTRPFAAQVSEIAYEAKTVNSVTTYQVDLTPKKAPGFLRSGMTASASFLVAKKNGALLLPSEAIHPEEGGKQTVWVPNTEGKERPISREIKLGLTDGKQVEIVAGVAEGDVVLAVDPLSGLKAKKPKGSSPFGMAGKAKLK